jgi:hypothetical protein
MVKSAAATGGGAVPTASDDVLPSATDVMKQVAEIEAKKAADYLRKQKAEQAEKKALLDQLSKPSGLSEEEKKKRAAAVINRAVKNGLTEVQVLRRSSAQISVEQSISRKPGGKRRSPAYRRKCISSGMITCVPEDTSCGTRWWTFPAAYLATLA